jgi:hypothetical protein
MREHSSQPDRAPRGSDTSGGRPIPVRAMMGSSDPAHPLADEASSKVIKVGDEEWIARAIGSTQSGTAPDSGSPLLLVVFSRVQEPEAYVCEAMGIGESLADLSHHALEFLFERARPYRQGDEISGHAMPDETQAATGASGDPSKGRSSSPHSPT